MHNMDAVSRPVALRCTIKKGAFSGERILEVRDFDYVGIAPVHYFRTSNGHELDETTSNQSLDGMVRARMVEQGTDSVLIVMPSGETLTVNAKVAEHCLVESSNGLDNSNVSI